VVGGEGFRQARVVEIGTEILVFRIHIGGDSVGDGNCRSGVAFDFGFLPDAAGNDGSIQEVIARDFLEERFADVADEGGIFDGGGMGVDIFTAVVPVGIEVVSEFSEIDAGEISKGEIAGMGIMDSVEDGDLPDFGIGGECSAGHPVVAVKDGSPFVLAADVLQIGVDNLGLKFRRASGGVPFVGAALVFENSGGDQMNIFGIELVAALDPFGFRKVGFLEKPPLEVQRDEMDGDFAFGKPLAQGRDDFAAAAEFAGNIMR